MKPRHKNMQPFSSVGKHNIGFGFALCLFGLLCLASEQLQSLANKNRRDTHNYSRKTVEILVISLQSLKSLTRGEGGRCGLLPNKGY